MELSIDRDGASITGIQWLVFEHIENVRKNIVCASHSFAPNL
jgi:hypothetical protein